MHMHQSGRVIEYQKGYWLMGTPSMLKLENQECEFGD